MRRDLDVPYVPASAVDLRWQLGAPPQPALDSFARSGPMGTAELRVLATSHQAVFVGSGAALVETVAADLPGGAPVPEQTEVAIDGIAYQFRSARQRHTPSRFPAEVDGLVAAHADAVDALVAVRAGNPHAVTILTLSVGPSTTAWRSWHAYPRTGEVVMTETLISHPSSV